MFSNELINQAQVVLNECRARDVRVVTVESCTGGLVAAVLTAVPGASDVVERGFVTYSNEAKTDLVGVPEALIARHGAVSAEVAAAMAEGGLNSSNADISVSVTGIAGPGGGTRDKPVGLVFLCAVRRDGEVLVRKCQFGDLGRDAIRRAAVHEALTLLIEAVA